MNDPSKTDQGLIEKNALLKQRIRELEEVESERRRTEEALRESEERYHSIFEHAIEGIYQASPEGYFISVNHALARMQGFESSLEMVATVTDIGSQIFSSPEAWQKYKEILDNQGTIVNFEFGLYGKDGSTVWVSTNARTVRNDDGKILYYEGKIEDITRRKEIEEMLQEKEETFRRLFEDSTDAILLFNKEGFVDCNRAAVAILEHLSKDEIVKKHPWDLSPQFQPDGRPSHEKASDMIDLAVRHGHHRFEWIHLKSDGTEFPVEVMLTPIVVGGRQLMHVVWRDITERKKAEKALRESEERYRQLVDSINKGIFVAQDGMLKFVNPMFTKITGYSKHDLTTLPFTEFIHPGDRSMVLDRHIKRMRGEKFSTRYEFRILTNDGNTRWVELDSVMIQWEDKPAALCFAGDITERKKAEEALKESEETLRSLINAASEPVLLTDPEGMVLMANEIMARRLHKSVGELIGLCQYDFFPADISQNRRKQFDKVVQTGKPVHFEDEREGRTFEISAFPVFDEGGKVSKISIFAADITERKDMEEALQEAEKKFRDLAEESIVGIYLIQDGIFRYVNRKLAEMLGYRVDEILDKMGPKDVVFAEDIPMLEENLDKRMSGEIQSLNYGFRTITRDRSIRNVEVYSTRTTYQGKPSVIGTLLDITDRTHAEEERERLILELKDALSQVKVLSGLLPICASCKKIRNDKGSWEQMEVYIRDRSEAEFSHGICPECAQRLYPEFFKKE